MCALVSIHAQAHTYKGVHTHTGTHTQRKHYNLIHIWLRACNELTNMYETNHKQLECQKHKDVETFYFIGLIFRYLFVKA